MSAFCYLANPRFSERPPGLAVSDLFDRLVDLLLDQGRYALEQVAREAARGSAAVDALIEAGLLRRSDTAGLDLTPLALARCEEQTLRELFTAMGRTGPGRHDRGVHGGPTPAEDVVRHIPGEPLDHIDLTQTLGNALSRGSPFSLREEDVAVRRAESSGRCATVLLLDLSGSMARHGKFNAARRAALALRGLIRRHHPGDELTVVGFATRAVPLPGQRLLEARPCDVGLFDPRQAVLRVAEDGTEVPEHFTNIQAALRFARRHLRSRSGWLRQVLLVTDGEPTAHIEGKELVLAYPPTEATLEHTLREAARCAAEGIALSLIGLTDGFAPQSLDAFIRRLAKAGRGVAVCCPPARLGRCLIDRAKMKTGERA